MNRFRLFSESDLDRLEAAALKILDEVGLLIQDDTICAALVKAGARSAGPEQPVRLPRELVREVIAEQKKHQAAKPPAAEPRIPAGPTEPRLGMAVHVAQFYYDGDRKQRREPTIEDFLFCLRFGDVHCPEWGVSHMLLLRGHSPFMQNLEALYLILRHANHVGNSYVHFGEQVPYFAEIGRIWANDPFRFTGACAFAATPLRFDRRACGVIRALAEMGRAPAIGTMVTSGASTPVTPAGAVAVGAAEVLGGMTMEHALGAPGPYQGGIATGSLDMRQANADFASPEAMLQDIGICELFERRLGGHAGIWGRSDYTCATVPGIQAAYERCFEAMWYALARGDGLGFGSGLLESGKTLCLEQLLIDEEVLRMHWRVARGMAVSDETIDLPDILRIGVGNSGETHLATEHTLRHMREAWAPALFDRGVWDEAKARRADDAILDRAHQMVLDAVARYRAPSPDPAKLRAVRQVLDRAAKESDKVAE
jgi:trimethylamine--corrinoid protein Co-methyltransferase